MRDDLLDVQACIDWANAQLEVLEARIQSWHDGRPYELVEEMHLEVGQKFYKLANVRRLPPIINAEAGLIINSLRSSLDLLANTLAARNGFPNKERTQFPICRSEANFRVGKHAGHKEIRLLSPPDQQVIENLKPWAGGHPHLFDLHTLDNARKHRNLIGVFVMPTRMTISPLDWDAGFRFSGIWYGFENDAVVGWAKIDTPKPDIDLSLEVTLSEGRPFPTEPILSVLHDFTRSTQAIVALFGQ